MEFNESKTVSVDFEKTNSISSDEGSYSMHNKAHTSQGGGGNNRKARQISSNSLTVQSYSTHLNQSMPNLASGPYHINSNNTLLVPSAQKSRSAHSSHSGNLLSPSQRGISYPPPSPNRWESFFQRFNITFMMTILFIPQSDTTSRFCIFNVNKQ